MDFFLACSMWGVGLVFAAYFGFKFMFRSVPVKWDLPSGARNLRHYDMRSDLALQSERHSADTDDWVYRRTVFSKELKTSPFEDVKTLYDALQRGIRLYPDNACLGYRKIDPSTGHAGDYTWLTYRQVGDRVDRFGSGMRYLGIEPNQHRVGIYSNNRIEWTIAAESCNSQSLVTVALYDTFGKENVAYIVNHAELCCIICNGDRLNRLIEILPMTKGTVRMIVCMDAVDEAARSRCSMHGVSLYSFNQVEGFGEQNPHAHIPPSPEDLAIIMYTSGTTGPPKGVQILHKNVVATMAGFLEVIFPISENDVFPSYLPLAHILQRACESGFFMFGGRIGYWQGDFKKLLEDLQVLRPTLMAGVPRVFEKIKAGLEQNVADGGWIKKTLFRIAFRYKLRALRAGYTSPFWDKMVFRHVQQRIGGRLRGFLSGGAALRCETQEFINVVFGCPIAQGYGLTETSAGGTMSLYWDTTGSYGTVGAPLSCLEIKLADAPELGYLRTNNPPQGEICIRGPNVFPGYFKDEKATKEVFDEGGFFHTGDIGQYNANGTFSIIDRKKNIVKLAQGEYVALEKLETIYLGSKFVEQICVHADMYHHCLVCIVVPRGSVVKEHARQHGYLHSDYVALLKNTQLVADVLADLQAVAKKEKLNGYEIVRGVHLEEEQFGGDLVTPSQKLRRSEIKKKYNNEIDDLYRNIE